MDDNIAKLQTVIHKHLDEVKAICGVLVTEIDELQTSIKEARHALLRTNKEYQASKEEEKIAYNTRITP